MKAYDQPAGDPFDIGFGPTLPDQEILATGLNSTQPYISAEQFEFERKLFGHLWLYVDRMDRIAKPGQWIVHDIDVCNSSVIIVNDRNEGLKAFHNFCPHRGMRLMWEKRGQGNLIVCPYHAWSFSTDGALKAVPDEGSFDGLCKADNGLKPVHVDTWAGFIFINLDPQPRVSLRQYLGAIADRLEGAPFDEFSCSATVTEVIPANWKLGNESGTEGYHVPALHSKSASFALPSYNRFAHYHGWEPVGVHRVTSIPGNPDFEPSPTKPIQTFVFTHMPQMVAHTSGDKSEFAGKGFKDHPDLNVTNAPDWGGDQYSLFPGTAIAASYNGWWTNTFLPVTADTCRWTASWHFRTPRSRRERFAMECSAAQNRDILTEDNFSIRGQHEGFKAGVIKQVRFGKAEMLLRHQAAVMKAIVEKGLDDDSISQPLPEQIAAE